MFNTILHYSFALFLTSLKLLFKRSAAPFHLWSPDIYDAIPTIVITLVAIFTKSLYIYIAIVAIYKQIFISI